MQQKLFFFLKLSRRRKNEVYVAFNLHTFFAIKYRHFVFFLENVPLKNFKSLSEMLKLCCVSSHNPAQTHQLAF